MLDFDEYSKILRQWVKDGYPLITDNVLRTQIAEFEAKLENDEQYNSNINNIRDQINAIIKPIDNCNDYNILEYYKKILQKYGVDKQDMEAFIKANQDVVVETEAPTYRLYDLILSNYIEDNNAHNILHETVSKIIKNITSITIEPNISLAKSLKENPIILCYATGKYNACMDISIVDGKERPTLWLRIPEDNIPNIDSLASTISHELGHWLDFASKDFDDYYESRSTSECFADIIGLKLAQNAGYNFEKFIERIAGFFEEFNTPEMLKYKIMAQKRYDFINQIYKKIKERV